MKFIFKLLQKHLWPLVLIFTFCGLTAARAQTEYEVKAAFLYNFGKFVEWPANGFESTNSPLLIGVYGENPFHGDLRKIVQGKTIGGRPIVARSISFSELKKCRILFISASEQKNLDKILKELDGAGVLTVTENFDPFKSGVMINFVVENDKIRFEINNHAAEKVGLKISSKLLMLAKRTAMNRRNQSRKLFCALFP